MISHKCIEEVESSIGRRLSLAERVWFGYSAQVPDFWLYCHSLFFLLLVFNLGSLPMVLAHFVSSLRRFKLQPHAMYPPPQLWVYYKTALSIFFIVVAPLQMLSYPAIKWVGVRMGLPLPSIWEVLCQVAVFFLLEDYANYWIHRWLHTRWAYKYIHYMHHEITAPLGFATFYTHWAEIVLLGIPSSLGPAITAPHIITLWLWVSLRQLEAMDTHSGYDFPWSLTKFIPFYGGSRYHDYHHLVGGKSQCNFASVFTYCDLLYGTYKGSISMAIGKIYPIENCVSQPKSSDFSSSEMST